MSWCEEENGAKSSSDFLIDSTLADCKNSGRQDDILSRKSRRRVPNKVCRIMSPLPAEKQQALRSKSSVLCSYQTQRERAISQQTETNVDGISSTNHQPQSKELTGGARPKDYRPQERDLKIDEEDRSTNFASKLNSEITFLPRRIKPAQFNASEKSINRFHQTTISKQSDDDGKISVGRPTIFAKARNKPNKVVSNPENSNYVSDKRATPSSASQKDNTLSQPFLYPAINGQKNVLKEKSSLTGKDDKSLASCLFNHHRSVVRNTNARYNSRSRIGGNKQTSVSPLTRCKNTSTSSEDLDKLDLESPVFTGVQKIIENRGLVPPSAPNNGINSSHSTSSYKKSCPNSLVLLDSSDISSSCDESNALDCWSDGEILFPKQIESYSLECVGKSNEMCDDEVISNLHKKLKQICSDDIMADSEFYSFESESDASLSDSFKLAESYGKNRRRWESLFSKKFTDDKAKSDSSSNESNESGHASLVFPTLENSVDVLFRTPIENFNDGDSDRDITDHQKYGNEFGGAVKEEINCNASRRFLENCEYSSLSEADDEFECDCDVCQTCQFRQQNRGEWLVGEVDVAETNEQNNYVADADFEYGAAFSVTSDEPDVNGLWESILSGDARLETLLQELMEQMLMVDAEFLEHPAAPLVTDLDFDRLPSTRVKQSETCEENFCAICLSCYDEDDETKVLPCGHNFHLPCIKVWLNKSGTCPICRDVVLKSSALS